MSTRSVRWCAAALVAIVGAFTTTATPHAAGADRPAADVALGPEVPATANDLRSVRAQNSPQLASDPIESRFVAMAIRLDAPAFGCSLAISGDGGGSWLPVDPVTRMPAGADKCYAPQIAFDGNGVLYYLFVGLHGNGNSPMGVFLTKSGNRARSFTQPRAVLGPENYQVQMAIDTNQGAGGRIHLVWLHALTAAPTGGLAPPPNPLMEAYSDDGGATFNAPRQLTPQGPLLDVAPALALGPGHAVYVLYYDLGADVRDYEGLEGPTWPGRWSLRMVSSSDGGQTFTAERVVDNNVVPPQRVMLIYTMPAPSLAVDDTSGAIYVAWTDARNGDWDVFLRRSVDSGRTWTAPVRLNDDALSNGRNQYLPRIAVSPNGRVDAIFYDQRDDPTGVYSNVYYTESLDGGMTFSRNVRLTTVASNTHSGQRYLIPSAAGLVDFGSRLGLLSRDNDMVAAWVDTRNAPFSPYQDVYTMDIDQAVATPPWWLYAAIAFVAVFALAGAAAVLVARSSSRRRQQESAARVAP